MVLKIDDCFENHVKFPALIYFSNTIYFCFYRPIVKPCTVVPFLKAPIFKRKFEMVIDFYLPF